MKKFLCFIAVFALILSVSANTPKITNFQKPQAVVNLLHGEDPATGVSTIVQSLDAIDSDVAHALSKVPYVTPGSITGIGDGILTEEAINDFSVLTLTDANAKLRNFELSAAATLEVTSTSANDTSDGTGARTLVLNGVSSTGAAISETITLAGQTEAVTTNLFYRLNGAYVATAGTGGKNAGIIYVSLADTHSGGTPATAAKTLIAIPIGNNRAHDAVYTVPLGKKMVIKSIKVTCATAQIGSAFLWVKPYGGLKALERAGHFYQNTVELVSDGALTLDERTDFYVSALAAAASKVTVKIEHYLVNK